MGVVKLAKRKAEQTSFQRPSFNKECSVSSMYLGSPKRLRISRGTGNRIHGTVSFYNGDYMKAYLYQ